MNENLSPESRARISKRIGFVDLTDGYADIVRIDGPDIPILTITVEGEPDEQPLARILLGRLREIVEADESLAVKLVRRRNA